MTKLARPVVRETAEFDRAQPIVVELHPKYLTMRLKGGRTETYNAGYDVLLAWLRKRDYQQSVKERAKNAK